MINAEIIRNVGSINFLVNVILMFHYRSQELCHVFDLCNDFILHSRDLTNMHSVISRLTLLTNFEQYLCVSLRYLSLAL